MKASSKISSWVSLLHNQHLSFPPNILEYHQHLIRLFLFSAYGNVVELRINTKGVGGKLPNFGFVVFDDSDPVQKILGAKVQGHLLLFDRTLSFLTH